MRKHYGAFALGLGVMLVVCILPQTIASGPCPPRIRLPPDSRSVTMRAEKGNNAWFTMHLSDVPAGYDIVDGSYSGWCIDEHTNMTRDVDHQVYLYSSFDDNLPAEYNNDEWAKINYVLNHRLGNSTCIQQTLWWYSDHEKYPKFQPAIDMVKAADANASGYCPGPGEVCAVVLDGVQQIQRTFLEFTLLSENALGGLVWNDENKNGIQDYGEAGIPGIRVALYSSSGAKFLETMTNTRGTYDFNTAPTGSYYLTFYPQEYKITAQNKGSDDTRDSDIDLKTASTPTFAYNTTVKQSHWDCGLYSTNPPGNLNRPPTADAGAGEPYTGKTGKPIMFNASRSYDRDGYIVSYAWVFGDGMNGTGKTASHVYVKAGVFKAFLTVTDDDGASNIYHTEVVIRKVDQWPSPPQINGVLYGSIGVLYNFTLLSYDPDGDGLTYHIDWGDGTNETTTQQMSNMSTTQGHEWTMNGAYKITATAIDPQMNSSEEGQAIIFIGIHNVGSYGYLIDTNGTGVFDSFFSNSTQNHSAVQAKGVDQYLIDSNCDGKFDMLYNLTADSIKEVKPAPVATLNFITIGTLAVFVLVVSLIALFAVLLMHLRKKKHMKK
jgi:hypothetical protein